LVAQRGRGGNVVDIGMRSAQVRTCTLVLPHAGRTQTCPYRANNLSNAIA
jgi:hypothetical protein